LIQKHTSKSQTCPVQSRSILTSNSDKLSNRKWSWYIPQRISNNYCWPPNDWSILSRKKNSITAKDFRVLLFFMLYVKETYMAYTFSYICFSSTTKIWKAMEFVYFIYLLTKHTWNICLINWTVSRTNKKEKEMNVRMKIDNLVLIYKKNHRE
jgi:hypothetical protein